MHRLDLGGVHVAALAADDDAIGPQKVVDRGAFLEELGIADDAHVRRGVLAKVGAQVSIGAGGNGALDDDGDDLITLFSGAFFQSAAHLAPGGFEVAHVNGAIGLGRRADGEKDDLCMLDAVGDVAGEAQSTFAQIFGHALGEPWLENGTLPRLKLGKLAGQLLHADHRVTGVGETGTSDESNVAAANDSDVHDGEGFR